MTIIEKVDPVGCESANVLLLNAMAATASKGDIAELFQLKFPKGEHCLVDVQLIVNGVSVPFMATVKEAWETLEASIDEQVLKRALELVSHARLDGVKMALDNAEWQIEETLRKALKDHE